MFKPYKGNDVEEGYTRIQGVWMRLTLDENYDSYDDSYDSQTKSCTSRINLDCLGWGYKDEQEFKFSAEEKELLNKNFRKRYPNVRYSYSFSN